MIMNVNMKFEVLGFESTLSGNYARVTHKTCSYAIIPNFGWKKGDKVELIGYDYSKPKRMIVNGKEITNIRRV